MLETWEGWNVCGKHTGTDMVAFATAAADLTRGLLLHRHAGVLLLCADIGCVPWLRRTLKPQLLQVAVCIGVSCLGMLDAVGIGRGVTWVGGVHPDCCHRLLGLGGFESAGLGRMLQWVLLRWCVKLV